MASGHTLTPAVELVGQPAKRFPNESDAYRKARNALLVEEIELRRHLSRVAAQRRALPPGGEVTRDYRFTGADGEVGLADLFGRHDTLIVYSMMYGPQRKQGCPMCTSQLASWEPEVRHLQQRVAIAVVARSPYPRLAAYGREQGWTDMPLYSDDSGDFTADFVGERDADMPAYTVFSRRDGTLRHFYSAEGGAHLADPGQDPHNAPDMNPLWILLDTTPEGRGTDWYPRLDDAPRRN
ncbi:DUF899 family protein [Luteimonas terrae]|uniref:Dithiol-disulfide oxidoreductase (DUF899 family) n=1 Tax=Luteimonas terrae TaxID=1530191 RepID=A0ABU1XWG4_9GAMM|nr:DUF899 family protein [Luteimonas terrae]MDR7192416.1 putative dithiol-disulfide oxidoreductase (DUF899 family) [Luteimonas terrae]